MVVHSTLVLIPSSRLFLARAATTYVSRVGDPLLLSTENVTRERTTTPRESPRVQEVRKNARFFGNTLITLILCFSTKVSSERTCVRAALITNCASSEFFEVWKRGTSQNKQLSAFVDIGLGRHLYLTVLEVFEKYLMLPGKM